MPKPTHVCSSLLINLLLLGFLDSYGSTKVTPLGHPFLKFSLFPGFLHPFQNCVGSLHLVDVLWRSLTFAIQDPLVDGGLELAFAGFLFVPVVARLFVNFFLEL